MSTLSNNSKSPRRWLQFSMRSVLLLTLVAAVLSAWLIAPADRVRLLARSRANVREEVRLSTDPNTRQTISVLNGRWELFDERGLLRIRGTIENGELTGRWAYYDEVGDVVLEGESLLGLRVGPWTALHGDGKKRSEARYELARNREFESHPSPFAHMGGARGFGYAHITEWRGWEAPVSIRTGESRAWWPSGHERLIGAYAPNSVPLTLTAAATLVRRGAPPAQTVAGAGPKRPAAVPLEIPDGTWSTFDEQGSVTSAGEYRHGLREGRWRYPQAKDDSQKKVSYVNGRAVVAPEAELQRLVKQLDAPTFRARHQAMRRIIQLGDVARPSLLAWLQDANLERRRMAAGAMAQIAAHDDETLALLAEVAVDATSPRDLRLLVLASLDKPFGESHGAAEKLVALASHAEPDMELRNAARLARVRLSPDAFDPTAEQLLIEFAAPDRATGYAAFATLTTLVMEGNAPDIAPVVRRLDRPTRLALVAVLRGYSEVKYAAIFASPLASQLRELLQSDADNAIRALAADLPDNAPSSGGGFF